MWTADGFLCPVDTFSILVPHGYLASDNSQGIKGGWRWWGQCLLRIDRINTSVFFVTEGSSKQCVCACELLNIKWAWGEGSCLSGVPFPTKSGTIFSPKSFLCHLDTELKCAVGPCLCRGVKGKNKPQNTEALTYICRDCWSGHLAHPSRSAV